jgi:transketolase
MKFHSREQFWNWIKGRDCWLLTGDLGYPLVETYKPKYFINCGVIEQTMAGIATGLALSGKEVYIYSGATFLNYRCIEAIRNAWMQGLNVKVVATGASGFLGDSHNFRKGEVEPLEVLSKFLKNKNYIRL